VQTDLARFSILPARTASWHGGMALACLIALPLLQAGPAAAQVCDKVAGPGWTPANGPVAMGPAWYAPVIAGLLIAWFAGKPWLTFLAGAVAAIMAAMGALAPLVDEQVYNLAISEGCISRENDIMDMVLNAGLALGYVLLGLWQRHRSASALP
jgi:hypothetical protein